MKTYASNSWYTAYSRRSHGLVGKQDLRVPAWTRTQQFWLVCWPSTKSVMSALDSSFVYLCAVTLEHEIDEKPVQICGSIIRQTDSRMRREIVSCCRQNRRRRSCIVHGAVFIADENQG